MDPNLQAMSSNSSV